MAYKMTEWFKFDLSPYARFRKFIISYDGRKFLFSEEKGSTPGFPDATAPDIALQSRGNNIENHGKCTIEEMKAIAVGVFLGYASDSVIDRVLQAIDDKVRELQQVRS